MHGACSAPPPSHCQAESNTPSVSWCSLQVDELEKKEEELFRTGPLSVLTTSVKTNSQVRTAQSRWQQQQRRAIWWLAWARFLGEYFIG